MTIGGSDNKGQQSMSGASRPAIAPGVASRSAQDSTTNAKGALP